MSRLESSLKDQGHWIELPSLVQLNEMYEFAKPAIAVPQVAGQKRRREGQLVWTTIVKKLRLASKTAPVS